MAEETRPGRIVGDRYRLVAELGSGAFGRVWTAYDERLDTVVAVKEVRLPGWGTTEENAERLARAEREGRNAVRLRDHPNIVTVHDVVTDDGAPWLVMRLVAGISLKEHLDATGRLPVAQVAHVAAGLLAALAAAHAAGVVHRDVKPANVLLSTTGEVLLTDFGIAVHRADIAVTVPGMLVGTLAYTAPERFDGTDGAAGDLFSLGVVLYEAVTGASPFHRDSTTAALRAVLHEDPPPPDCLPAVRDLVTGLLAKDPHVRLGVPAATALLAGVDTEPVPVGRSAVDPAGRLLPKTKVLPVDPGPTPNPGRTPDPRTTADPGMAPESGTPLDPGTSAESGSDRNAGDGGRAPDDGGDGAGGSQGGGGSAGKPKGSGKAKPKTGGSGTSKPGGSSSAKPKQQDGAKPKQQGGNKPKEAATKPKQQGGNKPKKAAAKPKQPNAGTPKRQSGPKEYAAEPVRQDTGTTEAADTSAPATDAGGTGSGSSGGDGWKWLVGLAVLVILGGYLFGRNAHEAEVGGCVYTTDHKKLRREPCALHWPGGTSYSVLQRFASPTGSAGAYCANVAGWDRDVDTSWYYPQSGDDSAVTLCLKKLP
ncbi:serine/threonine-protein kinase [Actinocatenispora rupis]|uniref:non-specific serine/threonine protein kinase n=1 Tax=Actinocatenispora rupis TaxID=519421 RepID=A0A8J3JC11_9ACTN|nr:serine/threonine-protein kinase [Actinocatenispora rupis]GID13752.1 hypothetical protein Aru02nite_46410 [Actinocatenispora rupis]